MCLTIYGMKHLPCECLFRLYVGGDGWEVGVDVGVAQEVDADTLTAGLEGAFNVVK